MRTANEIKELTRDKGKLYTAIYEENHPVIIGNIEKAIMSAVEHGQYLVNVEMSMISEYDIKMIKKVLLKYGFTTDWTLVSKVDDSCQSGTLTIHWI